MKKIILATFLSMIFFAGYSQHTLAYNQAILVSNTQTVPQGTVWKVVSLLPSAGAVSNQAYNSPPSATSFTIMVNSNPISFSTVQSISTNSNTYNNFNYTSASGDGKLPIWLPAGSTLAAGSNIQYVSVLEFLVN